MVNTCKNCMDYDPYILPSGKRGTGICMVTEEIVSEDHKICKHFTKDELM